MTTQPIGYFPKITARKLPDFLDTGVEEICSVSTCISEGPPDWIERWLHNELCVFDTPELASRVIPQDGSDVYDLFAYSMLPVQFIRGSWQPYSVPQVLAEPTPSDFVRLGFDVVARLPNSTFLCSPLSCNYMAHEIGANRFCLIEDEARAMELGAIFEAERCEPGPYYIVDVWRATKTVESTGTSTDQ